MSPPEGVHDVLMKQQAATRSSLALDALRDGLMLARGIPMPGLQECAKVVEEIVEGVAQAKVRWF